MRRVKTVTAVYVASWAHPAVSDEDSRAVPGTGVAADSCGRPRRGRLDWGSSASRPRKATPLSCRHRPEVAARSLEWIGSCVPPPQSPLPADRPARNGSFAGR